MQPRTPPSSTSSSWPRGLPPLSPASNGSQSRQMADVRDAVAAPSRPTRPPLLRQPAIDITQRHAYAYLKNMAEDEQSSESAQEDWSEEMQPFARAQVFASRQLSSSSLIGLWTCLLRSNVSTASIQLSFSPFFTSSESWCAPVRSTVTEAAEAALIIFAVQFSCTAARYRGGRKDAK
jgi:hypothetical protein